ncbi:MAG: hypothetical protein IPF92_13020 [Myxococcales bacterium]|nr:hypothetical protein [Myxococcales bacterium]
MAGPAGSEPSPVGTASSAPNDAPRSDGALPRGADDAGAAELRDVVVDSLAVALARASEAGRWDVVALLAKELEARRLASLPNVVAIGAKRAE